MNPDDYAYFRRRAAQENEAARRALCEEARICHRNLAAEYRARCTPISVELAAPAISGKSPTPVAISLATKIDGRTAPAREGARCEIRL